MSQRKMWVCTQQPVCAKLICRLIADKCCNTYLLSMLPLFTSFISSVSPGPGCPSWHRHKRQPRTAPPDSAGAPQPAVSTLQGALHCPRPLLGQRCAPTAPVLPRPTSRRQLRATAVPTGLHSHMERWWGTVGGRLVWNHRTRKWKRDAKDQVEKWKNIPPCGSLQHVNQSDMLLTHSHDKQYRLFILDPVSCESVEVACYLFL